MNKEEALHEFIKGLRIAFNNSLAYPRRHPYFLKSVEEFKVKIAVLFNFLNPIKINITPESLFIDGKYWAKPLIYVELAQILHQRKIKAIELRPGLDTNELVDLLCAVALSPKDVIKNGGLGVILKKAATAHISVEELDYSTLLHEQGKEDPGDIWRYLFKGIIENKDANAINEIADNFSSGLKNINVKDIPFDDKLKQGLIDFLRYLKKNNKDKFSKCSSELFNYLANSKYAAPEEDIQSLKALFKDLDENDFAHILCSQISKKGHVDFLTLDLFLRFSQEADSDKIASILSKNTEVRLALKNNPLLAKTISDLLSNPDSQNISAVYRNTLISLLKNSSTQGNFIFDANELHINYCFVLLNLFNQEKESARASLLLTRLDKEWNFIIKNKDYEYIKYLLDALGDKQKEEANPLDSIGKYKILSYTAEDGSEGLQATLPRGNSEPKASAIGAEPLWTRKVMTNPPKAGEEFSCALDNFKNKISDFIEDNIWDEDFNAGLDHLAGLLEKSHKGSQFYLDKMFQEGKLSVHGVRLFLKFFPAELNHFYAGVEAKRYDLEYSSRIVEMLVGLRTNLSLVILEHIYSFANEIIKGEILKAMRGLPEFDKKFLFVVLKGKQRALKKEALKVLLRDEGARKDAFGILLKLGSPWGSRNKVILENMAIIGELGLKESIEYLIPFTKMKFFWRAPLKNKALNILESWK
ncbi:MAG: hypothetical protein COT38_00830 [Candidatus Omnitrophica bacterium CG08_land_8_20_14_0_20_41_16]|uniref:HEAT repeat domain-containing protein n=1 Tax=Candidatus Sherwoodlollariibacterium unditelluris TaxID=1974757 RepID=A0A2G9YK41_9BACT|nr:MAG: hypothetical protein COX41_01905 [Candidatus Omnitrophica bacterium CG23_combo_of_CG06-09_8_20_14_all_41_10]PIS34281.1 MAG: hypothetical protein COT38_00830 [Candidatus Omnitrophica bacterium CG08_land_8_20_14_0_20_41_16]